ncbi:hypothetical protein BC828DRAFT_388745 [Blastocladiella britannica]|nr:hypothetical protein BC828DRAFT_388745 [Blastocladiella britannica]
MFFLFFGLMSRAAPNAAGFAGLFVGQLASSPCRAMGKRLHLPLALGHKPMKEPRLEQLLSHEFLRHWRQLRYKQQSVLNLMRMLAIFAGHI